jgi:hypothetical protein
MRETSYYGDYGKDMDKISRCNICHKFFNSKRELKAHKDKEHRITNHKILKKKKITFLALYAKKR